MAVLTQRLDNTFWLFTHVAPRTYLAHEYVPKDIVMDLQKLRPHGVVFKCGGETTMESVLEEVARAHDAPMVFINSGMGDSHAIGAAHLETRLGGDIRRGHTGLTVIVTQACAKPGEGTFHGYVQTRNPPALGLVPIIRLQEGR